MVIFKVSLIKIFRFLSLVDKIEYYVSPKLSFSYSFQCTMPFKSILMHMYNLIILLCQHGLNNHFISNCVSFYSTCIRIECRFFTVLNIPPFSCFLFLPRFFDIWSLPIFPFLRQQDTSKRISTQCVLKSVFNVQFILCVGEDENYTTGCLNRYITHILHT